MQRAYLTLFLIFLTALSQAQTLDLEWVKSLESTSFNYGECVRLDPAGNVFITGGFEGTADFDPGSGVFNLSAGAGYSAYLQKLDTDGNFIWAKAFSGSHDVRGFVLDFDASGNIFMTGDFEGTADFDPGSGIFNLTSEGDNDVFVLKVDLNGDFLWATAFGGTGTDAIMSMHADVAGNVYTSGLFENTIDFDPGANSFDLTATGFRDAFLQKLDTNGDFEWAIRAGGTLTTLAADVRSNSLGNVYVVGSFEGTTDFDPGPNVFDLTSSSLYDLYVLLLDSAGNFIDVKTIGGDPRVTTSKMAMDELGNILITGWFNGATDFDPGTGTSVLTALDYQDVFVLKWDAALDFVWAKAISGPEGELSRWVTTDAENSVYTTGSFITSVDLDPGVADYNLTSNGDKDIFIQKLDVDGNFQWASSSGGVEFDRGESLAIDATGTVYLAGVFNGVVDFDPSSSTANLDAGATGSGETYCVKYDQTFVGIGTNDLFNNVKVYPNPTESHVTIDLGDEKEVTVNIFNIHGQLVYSRAQLSTSLHRFELDAAPGLYTVEVNINAERRFFKLILR
jgi:hypothetical protein